MQASACLMLSPPPPQMAEPDAWTQIPGADLVTATVTIVQAAELDGDPQKVKKRRRKEAREYLTVRATRLMPLPACGLASAR